MNGDSLGATGFQWPGWDHLWRVLTLADYNTRVVTLGVALLGVAAGVVGSFMLLRRRSLLGDALSHAALPGIALAFMAMALAGQTGKALPGLLAGALVTCLLGGGAVLLIRKATRIKEDAAIGIVLSVFFGWGVALLGMIQDMPQGNAAGLESFIYGKTASMIRSDAMLIGGCGLAVILVCAVLFKELRILCFDAGYASSLGWKVGALDMLLVTLAVIVTIVGLQAVGLILVVAFLITPAAAARFWTDRLWVMTIIAAFIGALSGAAGAMASALAPRVPAGALVVVICSLIFLLSMVFGIRRGILMRLIQAWSLSARIEMQNLMRVFYEYGEVSGDQQVVMTRTQLVEARSWPAWRVRWTLARAVRRGLVREKDQGWVLTEAGEREAARVVRNHRLWEAYLLEYADVAPHHVDRDADLVEHVLGEELVRKLETQLQQRQERRMPPSLHKLSPAFDPSGGRSQ